MTQATASGQVYDASLAENIANKTENDGIAETGEYYYVQIDYETESGMVDYDVVTTMTDVEVQSEIDYTVDKVVEITVDTPVETTNKEAVSVLVTSTAPAP